MQDDAVKARSAMVGIEPKDTWSLFKLLDGDASGVVDTEGFLAGCQRLGGGATRMDIQLLMYHLQASSKRIDQFMKHVVSKLHTEPESPISWQPSSQRMLNL